MRIEDYALVGDCHSGALVGRDGSIDWLCWPRFDSGACFAALLGRSEHGRWKIAPAGRHSATRKYRDDTLILETRFETAKGAATLIDFMPVRDQPTAMLAGAEQRRKARLRIEPRPAQPVDRAVARYQRGAAAIADQRVIFDGSGHVVLDRSAMTSFKKNRPRL